MAAPLRLVEGRAYPFARTNVDTDTIIPARHMKTVTRAGLGRFAFETIRATGDSIFDRADLLGAPILIAGANFGCGSSREHAVWALADLGIRVVIAPSFAEIFAGNAIRNGVAAIVVEPAAGRMLLNAVESTSLRVDIAAKTIGIVGTATRIHFHLDPFVQECLLEGLDEIALTLADLPAIERYEAWRRTNRPLIDPSER